MGANRKTLPLAYSCSGCSSAAQMANDLALALDRAGVVEMSCIAGVGGDVKPLVHKAKSGRPIVVLDGCPLHCARHCLARHGIVPDQHYDLSESGVNKEYHAGYDESEARRIFERVSAEVNALHHEDQHAQLN